MYQLLIVDDSKWAREGLPKVIDWASLDIEVAATCANAAKACKVLMNQPIDILLTDIRMVGMDGLELAEYVKVNYPHIRIVLISAYREFDYAYRAVQLGVSGYVLKPVVPEEIVKVMLPVVKSLRSEQGSAAARKPEGDKKVSSDRKIHALTINYLNQHISDKGLNLRQTATDLHVNYYYLSKCFKEGEGISFTEYVTNKRMQIATHLLTTTTMHVYEICDQIGLEPKNFHGLFRKYYKMTPQEYRKNAHLGEVPSAEERE